MLRTCSHVIALTAMVTCGLVTAHAADTMLTLACQGTVAIKSDIPGAYETPDPISMGLIVNFTNRTVQGTSHRGPYLFDDQLQIVDANENTVVFRGFSEFLGMTIAGDMDRVTGDVGMVAIAERGFPYVYALKCRPAQRMF